MAPARLLTLAAAVLWVAGCDLLPPDSPVEEQVVVESYQIAGEPLAPVRLTRTLPADTTYHAGEAGLEDASVEIELLGSDGSALHTYSYEGGRRGVYRPLDEEARVRPLGRYRLEARIPGWEGVVRAETIVPDTFSVLGGATPDTAVYREEGTYAVRVTASRYPGRESVYQLFTKPERVEEAMLTPAGRELVTGAESLGGGSPYEIRNLGGNEWPLVREGRYPHHEDGTLTVQHPWANFFFYGPSRIDIYVIDDNLYDLIRSDDAQQQGGGTPGEIPDIVDHVEHGTGIFGALARSRKSVVVQRP